MNNLLSYCGFIDAKIRASDKDLPVHDMIVGNSSMINKFISLLIRLLCTIALLPAVILKATKKGFRLDKVYLFITP